VPTMTKPNGGATALAPVTNLAEYTLAASEPYRVSVTLQGTSTLLFHRWNCEAVEAKSKAAKGSAAKKADDVESYVYRNDVGELCIPGEYLRQSVAGPAGAAKFRQDPRSSRKSALDLYKAGIVSLTELATLGVKDWDLLDQRRVTVQRAGITRCRPAMLQGWRAEFDIQVLLPEYIPPMDLLDVITRAGQLVGLADFRPTYGRFAVVRFEVMT
jgi:hypothetical protein